MAEEKRPNVVIYLVARDAAKALDFYVNGLGATEVMRWIDPENGKIGHGEFRIGAMALYLADEYPSMEAIGVKSPVALGGTTVNFWIEVDDLEAARDRALGAGAKLAEDIVYSENAERRRCRIMDPAGHVWTLSAK